MNDQMLNQSWNEVCERIKAYDGVDAAQAHAFFLRLHAQAMSDGFLMLTADNDFIKKWVERHYLDLIKQALFDLYKIPYTVIIEVDTEEDAQETSEDDNLVQVSQTPSAAPSETPTTTPSEVFSEVSTQTSSTTSYEEYREAVQAEGYIPLQQQPITLATEKAAVAEVMQNTEDTKDIPTVKRTKTAGFTPTVEEAQLKSQPIPAPPNHIPTSSLSFENFVIGDSNRMAYSMAVAVAETPGKAHLNPFFIYGKSGLGKTHLLRAIQNYIIEVFPQFKVVYVDSAELLSDFMEAGAAHDRDKSSYKNFKTYYEEADVLLIDDVQFLQGKTATLDIFFQIFNKMTNQGKQVVLSADRAPKNIDIDERYKSRFNSGGTFDIQPPEVETKLGIVKNFIEEYKQTNALPNLDIPDDIQIFIAENSSSNIRELKSAVIKVLYQILFLKQQNLSLDEVKHILENHFSGGLSKPLTVMDVQKNVEHFYGVSHADITGKKRTSNIVYARQIAIYLCRELLDLPFNDIGKHFNKDHSTAMYSFSNIEEKMKENRDIREELEVLRRMIMER